MMLSFEEVKKRPDLHNCNWFQQSAFAQPADPSGNSDLDVLLEAFQPSLFNSSLQHIAVIYPGCSSVLKVVADVLSSSVYQIPLVSDYGLMDSLQSALVQGSE